MAETYEEQLSIYQEELTQWNTLQPMLLSIMQQQYPEIYADGNLLTTTPPPPPVEDNVPLITRDESSHMQLDVNNDSTKYVKYALSNTAPRGATSFIDTGFSYFADEPFVPPPIPEPNTTTGEFISLQEINLVDSHAAYLERGPGQLGSVNSETGDTTNLNNIFCVFYIDNGKAFPIPNYQTLEVMLVEQSKTYDYITVATDEDRTLYDLNFDGNYANGPNNTFMSEGNTTLQEFNARKLPDRINTWNLRTRFDSGYRPKPPFARDPGDYYDPNQGQGNLYLEQVYQQQTYLEKLREEFEGKAIVLNATFNDSGDVDGSDVGTIRIMINGYWKSIFDHNVLRTYNILNGLGARMNEDLVECVDRLNKVKGITILQDDGSSSPVWNEFAHIKQVNFLDTTEYKRYYERSNGGNIFEVDYMLPYEPRGSTKYYSAASTNELQAQLIQELDAIQGQQEDQFIFNNAVRDLGDNLLSLKSQFETRIQSMESGLPSAVSELSPKISQIKDDLLYAIVSSGSPYTIENNVPFQLINTNTGAVEISNRNIMAVLHTMGENAQWGWNEEWNDLTSQIKLGYAQYFNNNTNIANVFADKLFFRQQYSDLTNPTEFNDKQINSIRHPAGSQLPDTDGDPNSVLTLEQSNESPAELFFHWDLFPPFASSRYTRSCISRYQKNKPWYPYNAALVSPSELGPPLATGYNATWEDILIPLNFWGSEGPMGVLNNNSWDFLNNLNYGFAQPTWFDQDMNTIFEGAQLLDDILATRLENLRRVYDDLSEQIDTWFRIPDDRESGILEPGIDFETGLEVPFGMYLPTDIQEFQSIYETRVNELEVYGAQESAGYLASANTMIDSLAASYITRIFNFIQTTRSIITNSEYNVELNWGGISAFIITKYRPDANFDGYDTLPFQSNVNLNEWLQSVESIPPASLIFNSTGAGAGTSE